MKRCLFLVAAVLLLLPMLGPAGEQQDKEPSTHSVEWLERGLNAALLCIRPGSQPTTMEKKWAFDAMHYFQGFIGGVNMSALLVNTKTENPLFYPGENMDRLDTAAPSILKFIHERRETIPRGAHASRILMAWYMRTHPKSTTGEMVTSAIVSLMPAPGRDRRATQHQPAAATSTTSPATSLTPARQTQPPAKAKTQESETPKAQATPAADDTEVERRLERLRKLREER